MYEKSSIALNIATRNTI